MKSFEQQYFQFFSNSLFVLLLFLWGSFWKGWALWKASQKRQLLWFIILLLVNTLGILEIFYIFYLNRWDLDKGRLLKFLGNKFAKK
jgi:methionyl-tRNA synthetase